MCRKIRIWNIVFDARRYLLAVCRAGELRLHSFVSRHYVEIRTQKSEKPAFDDHGWGVEEGLIRYARRLFLTIAIDSPRAFFRVRPFNLFFSPLLLYRHCETWSEPQRCRVASFLFFSHQIIYFVIPCGPRQGTTVGVAINSALPGELVWYSAASVSARHPEARDSNPCRGANKIYTFRYRDTSVLKFLSVLQLWIVSQSHLNSSQELRVFEKFFRIINFFCFNYFFFFFFITNFRQLIRQNIMLQYNNIIKVL